MEIFRLKTLRIKDNDVFKKEIEFSFTQGSDDFSFDAPYFTLILGPNGTGKSNLLKFIIEVFRGAYDKKTEAEYINYPKGKYYIEYTLGDKNYTILNTLGWEYGEEPPKNLRDEKDEKGIRFFKDSKEITAKAIQLPESILALSIMLTDKYLFLRDPEKYSIYKYLGVRRDGNTAGTRSFIGKTIENVFLAVNKKTFISDVREVLSFLDLGTEFYISYSPRYKAHFFSGNLKLREFENFFLNNKKYLPKRKTEPWSVAAFKALRDKEPKIIPDLVDALNFLSGKLEKYDESSRAEYFEFNLFEIGRESHRYFSLLPYLHSLDIISYPEITLKKQRFYNISESSSGEHHFISTIIGLLATITDNSLVLIDEPEISLHPNWQMKYIAFLNKIFKKYNSVHFIISSHSHFLVSDLKPENSSIIALQREAEISALPISNTYGWSPEEILYNVFKVKTVRNLYLESDLTDLLGLISENSKEKARIQKLLDSIQQIKITANDPLNAVIEEANEYLKAL